MIVLFHVVFVCYNDTAFLPGFGMFLYSYLYQNKMYFIALSALKRVWELHLRRPMNALRIDSKELILQL